MPRKPRHWLHLEHALAELERLEAPYVDRATLQETLDCSVTEAWRILKRLGATRGPGGALVLLKDVFLERLRQYLADPRVVFERERRGRLEAALAALSPQTRSRLVKVIQDGRPAEALALLNTRFASLPPGVALPPRSLHIDFRGREEFLAASPPWSSPSKTTPTKCSNSWRKEHARTNRAMIRRETSFSSL